MYTLRDLHKLKGCKVHIVASEGEYEGILKNFNVTMNQVTLERALMMPKRLPIGTLYFFVYEIESCKIIEMRKDISKSEAQNQPKGIVSNIIDYNSLTVDVHALRQNDKNLNFVSSCPKDDFQDVSDYFADSDDSDVEISPWEEENEEEFILSLPKYLGSSLPLDWLVISEINEEFFDVIKHINKESVVAVSFEGQSIGRSGKLSLIGISTRCCTFLFDILVLQKEAFHKGLKEVFENPGVQKVIHDCRQPSDALFHLYNTKLVNVFDTQIADVFVKLPSSKNGRVQQKVSSVSGCIKKYLHLTEDDIYPDEADCQLLKEAVDWICRPVSNVMKEVAIKNVILLRQLRSVLLEQMLSSYTQAVDVYLGVLRNATPEELELNPSSPDQLPEALLLNGLHTVHCKGFSETSVISSSAFYQNKESGIFDFILKNCTAKACSPRKDSNRYQKKRRSAIRLVHQSSASLSSDDEVENIKKRKPRGLSHRTHHSLSSGFPKEKAVLCDKKTCVDQPKLGLDNAVFEKISHISELTLKDVHHDPQTGVHPGRRDQLPSQWKVPSPEKSSPFIMQNLNSVEMPRKEYHVVCGEPLPSTVKPVEMGLCGPVPGKPSISEDCVKRNNLESQESASNQNFRCSRPSVSQLASKPKEQSLRHIASNHGTKQVEIRYMPAGMLR